LSPRSLAPLLLWRFSLSSLTRLRRLMRPKIDVKLRQRAFDLAAVAYEPNLDRLRELKSK
jgi:hypothetical protein